MDENVLINKQQLQTLQQRQEAAGAASPPQQPPTNPQEFQSIPQSSAGNVPPSGNKKKALARLLIGIVLVVIITVLVIMFFPQAGIGTQKVKLVWWGLWEDPNVVAPIIADFKKANPNIDIEYSKQDPKQYRERLATRIGLGKGPDIFRFHNTWYPMLSDVLLPLPSDVITQEDFKKNYYEVMQTDLIHNGGIYGIPLGADTLALFVNTELLESAGVTTPATWEDFVTAAKKLTVKDESGVIKTAGAALGSYGNITHASDVISMLFMQQGVDMEKIGESSQDEIDALDFYASFANSDTNTWDSTLDQSLIAFGQGKLAMYFGYSWDIFTIQRLNKDLPFAVYPVPMLFDRHTTVASYWVEGVSARSAHQKEALQFMHYLAQKETAQKLYTTAAKARGFGVPYARKDLADTLKSDKLLYPFVSQLENAKSSLLSSDTYDGDGGLNSMSNTYLGNAINGIMADGSSTPSVVETLNQGIAQALAKYGIQ